ncbi:sugar phosphate nucleotidyltransferase [Oscillospiraceae bacterium MB08-C2-2]|nr:sugar phosphate nucleotidyltransferase [Oscillospiraceae bacterium MB08-C2-2]
MKAVIMAGGEGSRLRPLTCDIPKPMARLCGRPMMEYILDLLGKHGVKQAVVTVRYLSHIIQEHFPQGKYREIELDFSEETSPLGTAGSVKLAVGQEGQPVLVISGDALCDFDLTAAAHMHSTTGADVTILAKKVEDPREYGIINVDAEGRVLGFLEKPAYSQAVSDLANTGIYILSPSALSMIPDGKSYDFAKDLFPLMLERGMKLMCCESEGYWCDIGDLETYISCQKDMLTGKVRCDIPGSRDRLGNIWAGDTEEIHGSVQGPAYIGRNVRIEEGAVIEEGTVLDDGCCVGAGTLITGSILLPGSLVDGECRLIGALVGPGASVKKGAVLYEGAALGDGAVVGARVTVRPGLKIWNRKTVAEGVTVTQHVKTDISGKGLFGDAGIFGQFGVEITPEFCARIGCALGSMKPRFRIGLGCSGHPSAQLLKAAVESGIRSTGAHVMDFGSNFRCMFEYCVNFCTLELGLFVDGGKNISLQLMTQGGLPATRELERGIEALLARGEFIRAPFDEVGNTVNFSGMEALYQSQLLKMAPKGLAGISVQVKSPSVPVQNMLREVLQRVGCDLWDGFALELSPQGDTVRIVENGRVIPHQRILTACCAAEFLRGRDVAVPFDAPRVIDTLAQKHGCEVYRYYNCPADQSDQKARKLAVSQMWSRDGLMLAMRFLSLIKKLGGLEHLEDLVPEFGTFSRDVSISRSPAGILRGLGNQSKGDITEGVVVRSDKGVVLVKPMKTGRAIQVLAEAMNSETAQELCADLEALVKNLDGVSPDSLR